MDLVGRMTPRTQSNVVQNELKHEKTFERNSYNKVRISKTSYDGDQIVHTIKVIKNNNKENLDTKYITEI